MKICFASLVDAPALQAYATLRLRYADSTVSISEDVCDCMNAGRAGARVLCRGIARRDASVERHKDVLEASAAKDARVGTTDAHELISTFLVDVPLRGLYRPTSVLFIC